jgi:DNA repair protein RadC
VLIHNHPSGDPRPSPEDIQMTKRVGKALEAIDVALSDHLIIGRKGYVSFRECSLV